MKKLILSLLLITSSLFAVDANLGIKTDAGLSVGDFFYKYTSPINNTVYINFKNIIKLKGFYPQIGLSYFLITHKEDPDRYLHNIMFTPSMCYDLKNLFAFHLGPVFDLAIYKDNLLKTAQVNYGFDTGADFILPIKKLKNQRIMFGIGNRTLFEPGNALTDFYLSFAYDFKLKKKEKKK